MMARTNIITRKCFKRLLSQMNHGFNNEPFGSELIEHVASKLMKEGMNKDGWGGIANIHRDYCGHGLVFTDYADFYLSRQTFKPGGLWNGHLERGKKVFALQLVHDGYFMGGLLGIWSRKIDFVAFWAT